MRKICVTVSETGKKIYVSAEQLKVLVKRGSVYARVLESYVGELVKKGVVENEGKEK